MSPPYSYLVGLDSIVDAVGLSQQYLLKHVFVGPRRYRVFRGSAEEIALVLAQLQNQGVEPILCLMDRVFLVSDSDGIWAVSNAFFEVAAQQYEAMITGDRNAACAKYLLSVAEGLGMGKGIGAVLDFGCGTGLSTNALRHTGRKLIGFDSSESMREQARAAGVDVRNAMAEIEDSSLTGAIACYVFHFGVRQTDVQELSRTTCDEGLIVANFHKKMGLNQAEKLFSLANFDVIEVDDHGAAGFGPVRAFRRGRR